MCRYNNVYYNKITLFLIIKVLIITLKLFIQNIIKMTPFTYKLVNFVNVDIPQLLKKINRLVEEWCSIHLNQYERHSRTSSVKCIAMKLHSNIMTSKNVSNYNSSNDMKWFISLLVSIFTYILVTLKIGK